MKSHFLKLSILFSALVITFTACKKEPTPYTIIQQETFIDIRNYGAWQLCSTPEAFPEASRTNDLSYGFNRALLSWYTIDPLFLRNNSATPDHITNNPDLQSSHFVREVFKREIDPDYISPNGIPTNLSVLNLSYYPSTRGSYNYDTEASDISSGINADGTLINPSSRWGGMYRKLDNTSLPDFALDFWIMDPFFENETFNGKIVFDIGEISEDILKDERMFFENGLPDQWDSFDTDTTTWGLVPTIQPLLNAFHSHPSNRQYEDVGYDGLSSAMGKEQTFHKDYLDKLALLFGTSSLAYNQAINDPSADDYHYFRGSDYDEQELNIIERYKRFNGTEGNSPTSEQYTEPYPTASTTLPNVEDINNNTELDIVNNYMSFELHITQTDFNAREYLKEKRTVQVEFNNGETDSISWYNIRIPRSAFQSNHGSLTNIPTKYVRIYLTGFEKETHLRFAKMDLVVSR